MTYDRWGAEISGEERSIEVWNSAWSSFLHFRGDPAESLAGVAAEDDGFVMGPVFCALYAVLAGSPLDASEVRTQAARAHRRARGEPEQAHVAALERMIAGDFTAAGAA
jgi:hypothetical protein